MKHFFAAFEKTSDIKFCDEKGAYKGMADLKISLEAMHQLEEKLASLEKAGVMAETKQSGELNMSGCASSSCMAWD